MSSNQIVEYEEDVPPSRVTDRRASRGMLLIAGMLLLLIAAIVAGLRLYGVRTADDGEEPAGSSAIADETISDPIRAAAQPTLAPEQVIVVATAVPVVIEPVVPVVSVTTVPRPPLSFESPPSIASGILHGLIAPFTFVMSLFAPTIRMYDPANAGILYDIGFLLGLLILLAMTQWWYFGGRRARRRRA